MVGGGSRDTMRERWREGEKGGERDEEGMEGMGGQRVNGGKQ